MDETGNIQWHQGFQSCIEYEYSPYQAVLSFETEHELSKDPLRIDMVIIKKNPKVQIDNLLGKIYRTYNLLEYKSPQDGLSIDDFYKVIGYACIYKSLGASVNAIPAEELTISMFRHARPRELFRELRRLSAEIEETAPGIYRIRGIINLSTQIVVTRELEKGTYSAFHAIAPGADEDELRKFLTDLNKPMTARDRNNVKTILRISMAANYELYEKIRRETAMERTFETLFKDVLDQRWSDGWSDGEVSGKAKGERSANLNTLRNLIKTMGWLPEQAMNAMGIPSSDQPDYKKLLEQS